ncbi:phage fiber-tail adaptor protein [Nocardia tengchongensis]|uniref:phage fiber-tail adaptor protein n=1 Tax=Nocardia tengchongensis TaxID=2055889 RepID=UPI0036CED723
MTSIAVVRDVFDALGRMTVSTPMWIDDSQLAVYALYGWRLQFGAPVAPLTADQIPTITMSVGDVRPWQLDWSQWLTGGETVASSLWIPGACVSLSSQSATATTTKTWITAVAAGTCLVTNRIRSTSTPARGDDQSVNVIVQQR